jgi:DNA-binding transcriptional MerR regulator
MPASRTQPVRPAMQARSSRRFKLHEICELLDVDYDGARYVLAQGVLPPGIESDPGSGNHRSFTQEQAVYLAVALRLKEAGVSIPRTKEIGPWTRKIQEWAINQGWDQGFAPFTDGLHTSHQWLLEIGDARYVRICTDANPSQEGLTVSPWTNMGIRREAAQARPSIIIRVDVSELARRLSGSRQKPPAKTRDS